MIQNLRLPRFNREVIMVAAAHQSGSWLGTCHNARLVGLHKKMTHLCLPSYLDISCFLDFGSLGKHEDLREIWMKWPTFPMKPQQLWKVLKPYYSALVGVADLARTTGGSTGVVVRVGWRNKESYISQFGVQLLLLGSSFAKPFWGFKRSRNLCFWGVLLNTATRTATAVPVGGSQRSVSWGWSNHEAQVNGRRK